MDEIHAPTNVDILLTDCAAEDADAVFDALAAAFPQAGGGHGPARAGTGAATAWSWSLAMGPHEHVLAHPQLHGPVRAELQGCPRDVREVRSALAEDFTVRDEGSVSGDQELELRLALSPLAG
ncbi:hypothetical protein [Streptacidiphilus monticola]|uniref:Uncharacterized protein n=1 Tax=Streptacidiphilus monticola TaxID=2161674 RepID=A0ABW1G6G1_9ACTN